jgi:hypothetical protein
MKSIVFILIIVVLFGCSASDSEKLDVINNRFVKEIVPAINRVGGQIDLNQLRKELNPELGILLNKGYLVNRTYKFGSMEEVKAFEGFQLIIDELKENAGIAPFYRAGMPSGLGSEESWDYDGPYYIWAIITSTTASKVDDLYKSAN